MDEAMDMGGDIGADEDMSFDMESDISSDDGADFGGDLASDEGIDLGDDLASDEGIDSGDDLASDEGFDLDDGFEEDMNDDTESIPEGTEVEDEGMDLNEESEDISEAEMDDNSPKESTDDPYNEDGSLKPNVEYTTGEYDYRYETDNQGRITSFQTDDLRLTERENRLPHNSYTPDKDETDHAGHLIGDRFGGSPELDNLVSQNARLNQGDYKAMENEWARALESGSHVEVAGDVSYDGNSHRPSSFDVFYTIDEDLYERSFLNTRSD